MCRKLLPVLLADDIICLLIEGEIAKGEIDSDLTAFLVAQKEKVLCCFQTWRLILPKARSSIWVTYKTAAVLKPLHKPKPLLRTSLKTDSHAAWPRSCLQRSRKRVDIAS